MHHAKALNFKTLRKFLVNKQRDETRTHGELVRERTLLPIFHSIKHFTAGKYIHRKLRRTIVKIFSRVIHKVTYIEA